jgi:predicted permease
MESHLELLVDELVAAGLGPAEARREARARFGDPAAWRRRTHRSNPRRTGTMTTMMTRILQDLRFALRGFRRSPGFTAMAVLTLSIALAGNTALFSVLDEAVLQALPFANSERLVFINGVHRTADGEAFRGASPMEFRDWQAQATRVDPVVAASGSTFTLTGVDAAQRLFGELVSEDYFSLLGGEAALGRTFTDEEYEIVDGPWVAVLSHGLWESAFGSDPGIVGNTIRLNDQSVEVVGVMPESFVGANMGSQLWTPFVQFGLVGNSDVLQARGSRWLPVIGRLASGATLDEAQAEFESIALGLQEQFPEAHEDRFARLVPFKESYLGTTGPLLWILFGAGSLLLVIAAANVANLLLVRAHARTRELTVRRAIGADSGRITGQLITESLALAFFGGVLGLLGARWALAAALPLVPAGVLPAYAQPEVSARAFGFTLAILVVVGLASGLVPALTSARRDLATTLRAGRSALSGRGNRAQKVFVVTQVGLALMLLVGAGLLTRSLRAQLSIDPGLDIEGVHALRVQPAQDRYANQEEMRIYSRELRRAVAAVPGVTASTVASDFPLRGGSAGAYAFRTDATDERIRVHYHMIAPDFFDLVGVDLLAGRLFTEADDLDAPGVALVTQAFVERVFPEAPSAAAALGRQVYFGSPESEDNLAEIVGVVENVRYRNLTQSLMDGPNSPDIFIPFAQFTPRSYEVAFRVAADTAAVLAGVRRAVIDVDPETPPYALASLEGLYRSQTALPRLAAVLMGAFSILALSLASVGIYGVLTFTVGQRGPEIALRRALGADAGDVARSVVFDALKLAGVGVVVGGLAALYGGRLLEALLFQVGTTDWWTLVATALALLGIATVAAAVPALRAARKDPAEALTGGD